jgi:phosphate starvation-inducible PhoH-like protein
MDPYMRPLIDSIEFLVGNQVARALFDQGLIEICPFSFMRGRTFSNAFIVFDEVQNATRNQLKMALTRIGEGSKAVVTADPSQCDLGEDKDLSSINDFHLFQGVRGIGFVKFTDNDVVRSKVVAQILECYARD